jgi:hypothetical protein
MYLLNILITIMHFDNFLYASYLSKIFYHDFLTYLLENEISNLLWSNVMFESFLLERDGQ